MKKYKNKLVVVLLIIISIITVSRSTYSHQGRTDKNGGHKDKNNVSGLGSYHYHCGGNPPHLHTKGACPYSSNSSSSKPSTNKNNSKSSSSNSTSTKKTTNTTKTPTASIPSTVPVDGVQINESIEKINIGETRKLTVTISPENATDKNIMWKSSNESIISIKDTGEIVAKKPGEVEITVTTSNGKTDIIKLIVKDNINTNANVEKTSVVNTSSSVKNINSTKSNNKSNDNIIVFVLILVLLGSGKYLIYRSKYYKEKK